MNEIIFRHYYDDDDEQIADLFNRAFQINGAGIVRTGKSWNWRYVQSPYFEPEMILLAEDKIKRKIIASVCVHPISNIFLNKKKYVVGYINDVCCHPAYTKRGIAKELMKRAIAYLENKKCDISMLTTDYNGFPRKQIYHKYGYKDIDKKVIVFNFANLFKIIKDLPGIFLFFPALFINSYIPRLIYQIRLKFLFFFNDFSYEIFYNQRHFEYRNYADKIIKKNYTGNPFYNIKEIIWSRINVASKRYKPTYILVRKNNIVLGCATLTHMNLYACKYGIKIRIGVVNEAILDIQHFKNKRNLFFGYIYLIDKIIKAAIKRIIGVVTFSVSVNNKEFVKALNTMRFFRFSEEAIMLKSFNEDFKIFKPKKLLYLPSYQIIGIP